MNEYNVGDLISDFLFITNFPEPCDKYTLAVEFFLRPMPVKDSFFTMRHSI